MVLILEILIGKDEEVVNSIGEPSEFTGFYDPESKERKTAEAMEQGQNAEPFEANMEGDKEEEAFWQAIFERGSQITIPTNDNV